MHLNKRKHNPKKSGWCLGTPDFQTGGQHCSSCRVEVMTDYGWAQRSVCFRRVWDNFGVCCARARRAPLPRAQSGQRINMIALQKPVNCVWKSFSILQSLSRFWKSFSILKSLSHFGKSFSIGAAESFSARRWRWVSRKDTKIRSSFALPRLLRNLRRN